MMKNGVSSSPNKGKRSRSRLPPSPEREVYDGIKYVRGYSATLVRIDGLDYSFEEVRAARVGYVAQAIDYRDAEAITNRELARRRWRESEQHKQERAAEERRKLEEERKKLAPLMEDQQHRVTSRSGLVTAEAGSKRVRARDDDEPYAMVQQKQQQNGSSRASVPPTLATAHFGRATSTAHDKDHDNHATRLKKRIRLDDEEEEEQSNHTTKPRSLAPLEPAATPSKEHVLATAASAKAAPRTPTMTIHTKKALDKVLPLFGGDTEATLHGETTGSLMAALRVGTTERFEGVRSGDPPTPTATINTKAAEANVLSLFSGGFEDDTKMLGEATLSSIPIEDRENAPSKIRSGSVSSKGGNIGPPRKALGLAVQKPKKTNREVLEQELAKENRKAAANTGASSELSRGTKRTCGDAVREVYTSCTSSDGGAGGELTGNLTWDDTGLLPAGVLAPSVSSVGIHIYDDHDLCSPPPSKQATTKPAVSKPVKLDMAVYDEASQDTSVLPAPVLQKPQPVSFAIYSDFEDSSVVTTSSRGGKKSNGSNGVTSPRITNSLKKPSTVVDPWLISEEKRLLDILKNKIESYPNFFDCRTERAPGKHLLKVPRGRRVSSVSDPQLELPEVCFEVEERIGEGAFATVFKVDIIDSSFMDLEAGETNAALKVLNEPSLWEWYIYHQIYERVPKQFHHHFVRFYSIHVYSDKALTLMQFSDGTLQDAMNCYHSMNKRMDEPLIIYYTLEMLKIVEILHSVEIIHGDIKPDNFLIKNNPSRELADWGSGSQGGWDSRGLVLIDYSRSIDTQLYTEGTVYKSGNHVEGFKCTEMTEGRPWTYQADLYGICGVVHCLLHGSFLETVRDPKTKELAPKQPFKRYHQADLWRPLFRDFLNVKDCNSIPDVGHHKRRFEEHLKANPSQAKAIKTLLARQNILMFERGKNSGPTKKK